MWPTIQAGTASTATPHVSGVIALLMEAFEAASIDSIEDAILSTCKQVPGVPDFRQGYGVIDPLGALEALERVWK